MPDFNDSKYKNTLPWNRGVSSEDRKVRDAHSAEDRRIMDLVRSDLEDEYLDPVVPPAVRDMVWSKAWEAGHSSGYADVACHYSEFAELANLAYSRGTADALADIDVDATVGTE